MEIDDFVVPFTVRLLAIVMVIAEGFEQNVNFDSAPDTKSTANSSQKFRR